jgi:divalent metal cation (Fe/Co/Zn/Cd) transporter
MPSIGASLFMIAVGAILRYAVSDALKGVSLPTIGLILMIVGIIGLVISLFMYMSAGRRGPDRVVERDRYVEPPARY